MPHAILSPSSSSRWLVCTPSARAEESVPSKDTTFTREGTLAHAVAEGILRAYHDNDAVAAYDSDQLMDLVVMGDEMFASVKETLDTMDSEGFDATEALDCAARYAQIVYSEYLEARREHPDGAELFIEAPLDLSLFVPQSFGTTDSAVIAGPTLKIFDFKYGRGVKVSAERNSQMMLYAIGTLFGPGEPYDIKFVEMNIVQPRIRNYSSWSIGADELTDWGWTVLAPVAKVAFVGEGRYVPGNHCHFCRVAPRCRALAESVAVTVEQGAKPELMEPEEIAAQLSSLEMVENWVKALKDYSLNRLLEGKSIPGYKLVEGRATTKVKDFDGAMRELTNAGFEAEDVLRPAELKTMTELKRLLTPKGYKQLVEPYTEKTPGKPALAPESDPRATYQPAEKAFENL